MLILAIETSCDETSVAVIKDKVILANIISSQIKFHKKFGGVVPEIASRKHLENITLIFQQALLQAKIKFKEIDLVAVTFGPGLEGSLVVGVAFAKSIAFAENKKLIGVNHILAHIYANFFQAEVYKKEKQKKLFPFLGLVVSGGHSDLIFFKSHQKKYLIGETIDDAPGEVLDKIGRLVGLSYPAGAIIDNLSQNINENVIKFPQSNLKDFNLSFSGLKTSVINFLQKNPAYSQQNNLPILLASFQKAVFEPIIKKTFLAVNKFKVKNLLVGGGVAANSYLRKRLAAEAKQQNINLYIPPLSLCTDNAAMIAIYSYYLKNKATTKYNLEVMPYLEIPPFI